MCVKTAANGTSVHTSYANSGTKNVALALGSLLALAALAESIVLLRIRIAWQPLAAFFICFALVLGAFVALTSADVITRLREWAAESPLMALGLPFLLLLPYFVFVVGTGT